ncbi:hypothetical protein EPIB1_632 [Tritonibacter mobilis]|nr:hypothetical protein EPIB1_632 [Tritonibacter mobilis]
MTQTVAETRNQSDAKNDKTDFVSEFRSKARPLAGDRIFREAEF